ncbi:DUF7208 family protein [Campylobacter coli]
MVVSSQRTLYNIDLQLRQTSGLPYKLMPNTTLNERFNIHPNFSFTENEYPSLKYFSIGIGGDDILDGSVGYPVSSHSPVDACLYKPIPFVMRKVSEDLTESERINYRFRKQEYINGENYICYYLKLITGFNIRDEFYKINTINGKSTLGLFNLDSINPLYPEPRERGIEYDNFDVMTDLAHKLDIEFTLLPNEVNDLKKVLEIHKVGSTRITEIALCTGKDIDGEARGVQVGYFCGVNLDLLQSLNLDTSITKKIELGGHENLRFGVSKNAV